MGGVYLKVTGTHLQTLTHPRRLVFKASRAWASVSLSVHGDGNVSPALPSVEENFFLPVFRTTC